MKSGLDLINKMSVAKVLDREFGRVATLAADPSLLQLNVQAERFGLSPSYWGRLRRGKVPLTGQLAAKIAMFLQPDSTDLQRLLIEELLAAGAAQLDTQTESAAVFIARVKEFFASIHTEDALLCVEYRDFPRSDRSSRYPELAASAGEAIADGLSLAQFQPFGTVEDPASDGGKWPPHRDLTGYLIRLRGRVRDVHKQMYAAASNAGASNPGERLVLYEHVDGGGRATFGIQSRIFYLETRVNDRPDYSVWEWVAGAEGDHFVKRDLEHIDRSAIAAQFEPIVSYWREKRTLPSTPAEMSASVKNYIREFSDVSTKGLESPWKPYERA